MKLLLLILGVAAIALNAILWYAKKQATKTKVDEPSNPRDELDGSSASPHEFKNSPKIKPLKESAAAELGITVEQLDRMSVEEIKQLATEKGLI